MVNIKASWVAKKTGDINDQAIGNLAVFFTQFIHYQFFDRIHFHKMTQRMSGAVGFAVAAHLIPSVTLNTDD